MVGVWSFIHEWTIYEYLMHRFEEGTLRLRELVRNGRYILKERWKKVKHLEPIRSTGFPDIKDIVLEGERKHRPAEVKFNTSLFNYHKTRKKEFNKFIKKRGFIIVLKHDQFPRGLQSNKINIFEIERTDFITFCRENFNRLLSKQMKARAETKVWLMYQGPNFNEGTNNIRPACKSHIWCPTENLTALELSKGDRVLFIKTKGASKQHLQRFRSNNLPRSWILTEIWIGEVTKPILSRDEYCQRFNLNLTTQLWKYDPQRNGDFRWNRVFKFKKIQVISNIDLEIHKIANKHPNFKEALYEVFTTQRAREIKQEDYQAFLEYLASKAVLTKRKQSSR